MPLWIEIVAMHKKICFCCPTTPRRVPVHSSSLRNDPIHVGEGTDHAKYQIDTPARHKDREIRFTSTISPLPGRKGSIEEGRGVNGSHLVG